MMPIVDLVQWIFEEFRISLSKQTPTASCCDAWNKLVDQPWHIMTIGLRHWAHRF